MSEYTGVILAAGRGRRMGRLGDQYPKTLLPVGDEPLIGHQLRLFRRLGIGRVFVVIGHLGAQVIAAIGDGARYGVEIEYIEQGLPLGSAFALGRLKPYLHGPFLLVLGDYYFEAPEAERLIACLDRGVSAVSSHEEADRHLLMEACELKVSPSGQLMSIVEKPANPSGCTKGCGVYAFQPSFMDSVARTPRTALRDEYELSIALDVHIASNQVVLVERIIDLDWNFTRAKDVLDCNLDWLKRRHAATFVSPGARIVDGTVLENVVVGSGAYISSMACLRQGVVFPDARVESRTNCESVLITPGHILQV